MEGRTIGTNNRRHVYSSVNAALLGTIRIWGPCTMSTIIQEMKCLTRAKQCQPYPLSVLRPLVEELEAQGYVRDRGHGRWEATNSFERKMIMSKN